MDISICWERPRTLLHRQQYTEQLLEQGITLYCMNTTMAKKPRLKECIPHWNFLNFFPLHTYISSKLYFIGSK